MDKSSTWENVCLNDEKFEQKVKFKLQFKHARTKILCPDFEKLALTLIFGQKCNFLNKMNKKCYQNSFVSLLPLESYGGGLDTVFFKVNFFYTL